jgi:hypothetical protein
VFVFGESGREALQGGHEPERLILHKALECRRRERRGARSAFAQAAKERLRDDPSAQANYKTKPFWGAAGASIDVARRVSLGLTPRQRPKGNLFT